MKRKYRNGSRICNILVFFILIFLIILYRHAKRACELVMEVGVQDTGIWIGAKRYKANILSNQPKKKHKTSLVTRNLGVESDTKLIILVTSDAWRGAARRSVIRETWARYHPLNHYLVKDRWQVFFAVGSRTDNKAKKYFLEREVGFYNDIIEGDFVEKFYHLPYKLQAAFEWASLYGNNAKYIMKTDDDVYINIEKIFRLLETKPANGLYMGNLRPSDNVKRKDNSFMPKYEEKYVISMEEYSEAKYPPFVSGASMFFSKDVVDRMVKIFSVVRVFKLDDVYIGFLMKALGVHVQEADPLGTQHGMFALNHDVQSGSCPLFPEAAMVHVRFKPGVDKRWCMYKLFHYPYNASYSDTCEVLNRYFFF